MNRDGFSILAMGFTGKKAMESKQEYIKVFNQMESFIYEKSTYTCIEARQARKLTRRAETDTIQKLVEYAKEQGSTHAEILYISKLTKALAALILASTFEVTEEN